MLNSEHYNRINNKQMCKIKQFMYDSISNEILLDKEIELTELLAQYTMREVYRKLKRYKADGYIKGRLVIQYGKKNGSKSNIEKVSFFEKEGFTIYSLQH